jgi:pimeloyl-ACP methyl ester carboxylesterase
MRSAVIVAMLAACGGSTAVAPTPTPPAPAPAAPAAEEGFITTDDGARLYYRKLGSGPRVAIVPGALFFREELDRLAARHTVVLYDMRNRGRSDRVPLARVSIANDVADLERVRAHVGAETFTPVGWSYLGMMVMLYAVQHPERVERVVQIGPLSRKLGTFLPVRGAHDDASWSTEASERAINELIASGLPDRDPGAYCRAHWDALKGVFVGKQETKARIPTPCDSENEWPKNLDPHFQKLFTTIFELEAPSWETFAALTIPVLTIHGTKDRQSPHAAGVEWSEHLSHARLVTVPDAAHMVWLDAPEVVDTIDAFLDGR